MEQLWICFTDPDGRELARYTQVGTFDGEMQATKELLAYENGLAPEDIQAHFVDK